MCRHIAEGKSWDIVGLQEITPLSKRDSDLYHFKDFMKADYNLEYNCVTSGREGAINVTCSIYPIIKETLTTFGYVDCVQIQTPAGIIVFCNAHPAWQKSVEQFVLMQNWITDVVIPSYIPSNLSATEKELYKQSLLARTILVGDMNAAYSQITTLVNGKFLGTCYLENTGFLGIDHVMYLNMARTEISGGVPPFNTLFIQPEIQSCKSTIEKWPTDHLGPVVAKFTTKELSLDLNSNPENYYDLNNDNNFNILDALFLVKYIFNNQTQLPNPKAILDINQNSIINLVDVVELIKILF